MSILLMNFVRRICSRRLPPGIYLVRLIAFYLPAGVNG